MTYLKLWLPYLFGLLSLIISVGIVFHSQPVEAETLRSPTAVAAPATQSNKSFEIENSARCQELSEPKFFFYTPAVTAISEDRLTVSGTVYASDLTPLSGALVEIWRNEVKRTNQAYSPLLFKGVVRTDHAGHYKFTTVKPSGSERAYLHYRVTYESHCPLLMNLHIITESQPQPAAEHIVAKVQVVGPVLQGPVDIVLPVPPQPEE